MSLRVKLALMTALLTFVGLALGLVVIYWSLLGLRLGELDRESRLLAEVILDAVVVRPEGTLRVPSVVESYLTDEDGASSAQVYVEGSLTWEGGVLNAPRPLDPAGLVEGRGARSVGAWRVFTAVGEDRDVAIQVGRPLAGFREMLTLYRTLSVPTSLFLALAASVLAWFMAGLALRPLRELTAAARDFERGGAIPEVPGRDEPAVLAKSFAALLERLRSERVREQEFLAYAAHELRTPISALRAGLESARSGRTKPDPALLDRLHGESVRMESLANNLLALSRAEGGDVRRERLGLDGLASAAYDRFQPLAIERGLDLELEIDGEVEEVSGDERLLAQALDNLIANALHFTKRGLVTIRCGTNGEFSFLEVSDTGRGFEEPVRAGLGLRVVRAVCAAHGARFELAKTGGGTRASIAVPARPGGGR